MRVQKHSFLFLEICGIKEEASNLSEGNHVVEGTAV